MVAIIELARTESRNPEVPEWLQDDYFHSIQELAQMGTKDILSADESETKRAILSVIATRRGAAVKISVEGLRMKVSAGCLQ